MKKTAALFLSVLMLLVSVFAPIAQAETKITLEDVNRFLNESAKLGPGTKANPVAVIEIDHIDGPQEEDLFYAFVSFKYEARNYIKYQVTYLSCTCRSASSSNLVSPEVPSRLAAVTAGMIMEDSLNWLKP